MANIKDVAKRAKVAISTVSYAMNNSPKVSQKTKKRILEIAQELGYHPDGAARSLKKRKTNIIGLFLKEVVGLYYSEIIEGVENAISKRGYDLIIASLHGGIMGNAYNLLREGRVDGAIVFGTPIIPDEMIREISRRTPIVVSDRDADLNIGSGEQICFISIDNNKGSTDAVNHLIQLGYKKIGYISGEDDSYDNRKRFQAYRKALSDSGLEYNEDWTVHGYYHEIETYNAMKDKIRYGDLPQAFFSASDEMAIGAIRAFEESGLIVPRDIGIIGFDDINIASYMRPSLTSVRYERYQMGKLAVELIFDMMDGNFKRRYINLETRLVVRESCGAMLRRR